MSHVDLLANVYDEDLEQMHTLVIILAKLDVADPEDVYLLLGLILMRLNGKQGEL